MTDERHAPISIHRIPIRGGLGSMVLVALLIWALLADLPQLRGRFLAGLAIGLVVALALIIWRRRFNQPPSVPYAARATFGRWK